MEVMLLGSQDSVLRYSSTGAPSSPPLVPLPLLDQQCGEDAAWLGGRDLALPSSMAPNAEGVTDGAVEIHSCPRPRT
jgi:hypothetical protein